MLDEHSKRITLIAKQALENGSPGTLSTLLLAAYRLIMRDRRRFLPSVKTALGTIAKQCILHADRSVRCHALHVARYVTGMSDAEHQQMLERYTVEGDTAMPLFPLVEAEMVVQEQALLHYEHTELAGSHSSLPITGADLSPRTVDICGVLLPKLATTVTNDNADTFVMTPSSATALHRVALAVSIGSAVLVHGPPSSGKTHLLSSLAQRAGRRLVTLHLTDATDAKSLLGNYVCTERPGEFEFQPGVLTKAAREGHWLCIEDVDVAPDDLVAVVGVVTWYSFYFV